MTQQPPSQNSDSPSQPGSPRGDARSVSRGTTSYPRLSVTVSAGGGGGGSGEPPSQGAQGDEQRQSFFGHLDELRVRLMRCLWIFFFGFFAFYFVSDSLLAVLRKPLFDALPPEQQKLYFTSLFENFLTHLKVAGYASLFFLSPLYFHQLWNFIRPGLYPRERKLVIPFVAAATFFFLAGAGFAYFVLFPIGFRYFVTYGGPTDVPLLTIDAFYGTALKLMTLFGAAFELPVLISFLGFLGVVDDTVLRAQRKNAIIGITAISAVVAPPDAMSMILLAVPLVLLYEVSIYVVGWFAQGRKARLAAEASPTRSGT